ncbi:MAG TPA: endospore germination permease [Clostridia bacterium]
MRIEKITNKECICALTLFIMGSTLIIGIGGAAQNDAWLAGIAGILMSLPMILIYSRIQSIFLGKDLFEILEYVFGNFFGKIIALIYIWYAFHLGAMVIRNLGEFINTVTMPETPILFPMLCMGLCCIVMVRLGVEEIGRFSAYLLPLLISIIGIVQLLALTEFHWNYLKPILGNGIKPVIEGGFSAFSFPFAETVLFLGVMFSLKTKKSPYKVYFFSIIFSGTLIIILTIRNIAILGKMLSMLYFPSHIAVSRINIMDFLQRIEVTVAVVFVIGAFVKSSVCLFVASKGIARVLKLNDYRSIVIQLGLLMIYFSYTVYDNIMEMRYWAFKVYQYYAFPMQVILPIIIWIFSEIKRKKFESTKKEQGAML